MEMANRLWENKKVVLSCKMITTIINIFVVVFCHCQKSVQLIAFNRPEANIEPQHTNNIHLWNSSLNFKQFNLGKHHLNSLNIYLKKEKLLSESFTLLHCESVAYGLTRPELSRSSMLGSRSSLELW